VMLPSRVGEGGITKETKGEPLGRILTCHRSRLAHSNWSRLTGSPGDRDGVSLARRILTVTYTYKPVALMVMGHGGEEVASFRPCTWRVRPTSG
jgi:hypothetical protein